jgi:mono/diheme cytochrome c family protein
MKKPFCFKGLIFLISLAAILLNSQVVLGQNEKGQSSPVPDNLDKIFQTSCMPCHGNDGGLMSRSKLNFSKWLDYSAAREAERASKICSMLKKGEMPPKKARESHPELIPTQEQVDLICDWAESLKKNR